MGNRNTPIQVKSLNLNEIFVFGSNLAGRHGKGAAKIAKERWGAIWGRASGLQGRTYAIPFKDGRKALDPDVKKVLPLEEIKPYVDEFIAFAKSHPTLTFQVIQIGCGEAGYKPHEVAPLFAEATDVYNINLPKVFWEILRKQKQAS